MSVTASSSNGTCFQDCENLGDAVPILISDIVVNMAVQPRSEVVWSTVKEYATLLDEGTIFPPIVVFRIVDHDDKPLVLSNGRHRLEAHKLCGRERISADVREGTLRDALLYAIESNAKNPLPLSNEDRNRMVMKLLEDDEWASWTDQKLANKCGVSRTYIATRRPLSSNPSAHTQYRTTDGPDGKPQIIKVRGESKKGSRELALKDRFPKRLLPPPVITLSKQEQSYNGSPVQPKSGATLRNQAIRTLKARGEKIREHVKCEELDYYVGLMTDKGIYHFAPLITVNVFHQMFAIALLTRDALIDESEKVRPGIRTVIVGELNDAVVRWIKRAAKYGIEVSSSV